MNNTEKCEHCGADVVAYSYKGGCPRCGAPNCCPQCCIIEDLRQRLLSLERRHRIINELLDNALMERDVARRLARKFYREAYNFCKDCDIQIEWNREYCCPCRDARQPGGMRP